MLFLQSMSVNFINLTVLNDILFGIPEAIGSAIGNAISTLLGKGCYYVIVKGLLYLVNLCYRFFSVFTGLKKIDYDGTSMSLLNVFFENSIITNIYWAMALVGMAMVFGFAVFAVVRKIFDIDDKQRASLGTILRNCFKSILTMLLLSSCISVVINGTNVLMQTFSYIFNNAETLGNPVYIEFSDDQYATMARVLNTVGNYSLSTSRESRYNINSCFNEIRGDLSKLESQNIFSGYYAEEDEAGNKICNWLTVLQELAHCADLSEDLSLDVYYENVSTAVISAMDTIKKNPDIYALKDYTWDNDIIETPDDCLIDRVVFLVGTISAGNSQSDKVSLSDAVRRPFYTGEKSIYDLTEVSKYFNIKLGGLDYLLIAVLAYFILKALVKAILQCASKIFVMISLYLVAPPIIATMPWDDGEKFKQWVQAFLIQTLGVFGTVIPMRILITLIPIILGDSLVLFPNDTVLNSIAKVVLLIGALVAVDSFSQLLTGILGNNAAAASMRASENAGMVGSKIVDTASGLAMGTAALGAKIGFGVGGTALGLAGSGIKYGFGKLKDKITGGAGDITDQEKEGLGGAKTVKGADGQPKKGANVNGEKDNGGKGSGDVDSEIQSKLGGNFNKGSENGGYNIKQSDAEKSAQSWLKKAGAPDVGGGAPQGGGTAPKSNGGSSDKDSGDNKKENGGQNEPPKQNPFQRMGNAIRSFFSRGGGNGNKGAGVQGEKDTGGQEIEMQDLSTSNDNASSSDSNLNQINNNNQQSEISNSQADNSSQPENNPLTNALKGAGLQAEMGGEENASAFRRHGGGEENNFDRGYGAVADSDSAAKDEEEKK